MGQTFLVRECLAGIQNEMTSPSQLEVPLIQNIWSLIFVNLWYLEIGHESLRRSKFRISVWIEKPIVSAYKGSH